MKRASCAGWSYCSWLPNKGTRRKHSSARVRQVARNSMFVPAAEFGAYREPAARRHAVQAPEVQSSFHFPPTVAGHTALSSACCRAIAAWPRAGDAHHTNTSAGLNNSCAARKEIWYPPLSTPTEALRQTAAGPQPEDEGLLAHAKQTRDLAKGTLTAFP